MTAVTRALVLNATYEPLAVVTARRAVVLVVGERADLLHHTGAALRSEHLSIPEPSVVILRSVVRVPFQRHAALNRRSVFARDGYRCQYCAGPAEGIDHVVPRSRGGQHSWDNVVAACRRCNTEKRDRYLHETSMRLRHHPSTPRGLSWVHVMVGSVPVDWEPYLRTAVSV